MKTLNYQRLLSLCFAIMLTVGFSLSLNTTQAQIPSTCKAEIFDCPGWGTGDRTVCHVNGDQVACNCGDSTECGGGGTSKPTTPTVGAP